MKPFIALFLIVSTFATLHIHGKDINLNRHQFFIGPEYYYMERTKAGGTKQEGNMIGVRVGYDRLKRYGWYWGADALYAYGKLSGHSGDDFKIRSEVTDMSIEGRLGYTFQQKTCLQLAFTPFVGIGGFEQRNNFIHPSPLHVHFKTRYPYATAGFLSWAHLWGNFEGGLNFKVRFPFDPKCHVSNDEAHDPVSQVIKERVQYRIEVPITYASCFCGSHVAISLSPFYEYRCYGGHPNFPFDFIKTEYKLWGATLEFMYRL